MTSGTNNPTGNRDRLVAGACYILGSSLMFATMGALIRGASATLPNEMIVFFRNVFALLFVMPLFIRRHSLRELATERPQLHLLRAGAGLGAMYCYFYALAHMKLAEAVLLSYTSPLFIPVIAAVWLKESVPRRVRLAIVTGFLGVVLILKPGFGIWQAVALIALGAAMMASVAMVTIRRMSSTEPPLRIVCHYTLLSTIISSVPLAWCWRTPRGSTWLLLVLIGLVAIIGQFLMTKGYSLAPAARVGPFIYGTVIFASLIGWLVWGEGLDPLTWIGAFIVCCAGILATSRVAPH